MDSITLKGATLPEIYSPYKIAKPQLAGFDIRGGAFQRVPVVSVQRSLSFTKIGSVHNWG